MIIKVIGIGRPNRGAELMLAAVKQHLDSHAEEFIVIEGTLSDFWGRFRSKLDRKFGIHVTGSLDWLINLIPLGIRRRFNWFTDSDVSVFLDASGFAYGDKWGADKLKRRLASDLPRWKRLGKKIILLPQALGPFTQPDFKDAVKTVVDLADLVFVRDQESYQYLVAVSGVRSNIILRPDFTNGVTVDTVETSPGQVAIIPNSKMIEMGEVNSLELYVNVMVSAINLVRSAGKSVYLLNHEGERDRAVINAINAALVTPVEVVDPKDPLKIKAVIKNAEVVISSRFHGLVSALSQGVPVIAMGWSHKYEELLNEYDARDYLIKVDAVAMETVLEKLMNDRARVELAKRLSERAEILKDATKKMWQQVDEIILSVH